MSRDIIAVVDDDEAVRLSTCQVLELSGFRVRLFRSGDDFIASGTTGSISCILLDLHMPGSDGLAVLRVLRDRGGSPPVLVITAHGDLGVAVQAMRLGAHDFIEKPYGAADLVASIESALESCAQAQDERALRRQATALVETLTRRQRQILHGIFQGMPNKIIAFELGLSIRTVEAYRSQLLAKLGVGSTAEAVRLAIAAGIGDEGLSLDAGDPGKPRPKPEKRNPS